MQIALNNMEEQKKNNEEEALFAVIVGNVVLGANLTIDEAQSLSDEVMKELGLKMVVLANQKYIDIEKILSM